MESDEAAALRRGGRVGLHRPAYRRDVEEHRAAGARREGGQRGNDGRHRRRDDHSVGRQQRLERLAHLEARAARGVQGRALDVVPANAVTRTQREGERAADETEPRDPDVHAGAASRAPRPIARATDDAREASVAKLSNVSDWNPSDST